MPVQTPGELVPPAAPPLDGAPADLPEDAAQAVPRVVARTDDETAGSTTKSNGSAADVGEPTEAVDVISAASDDDEWASERDW